VSCAATEILTETSKTMDFDPELNKGDLAVVPTELLDDLATWGIVLSKNTRVSKAKGF